MNIIYSKYNRERAQEFQLETLILSNSNGEKTVKKRPLSSKASMHIKNIFSNYFLLTDIYKNSELRIIPVELVEDGVQFPYIEGQSIDHLLLNTLLYNGGDSFLEEIVKYYYFLNNIVTKKFSGEFVSDQHFYEIFGQHIIVPNSNWLSISNIDMTFDNVIVNKDGEYFLIDYEWVFNIKVPLSFIMYRSISNFYIKHNDYLKNIIGKSTVLEHIGISDELTNMYEKMESNFQKYVAGDLSKFKIPSQYIQEHVSLETIKREQREYKEKFTHAQNEKNRLTNKLSQIESEKQRLLVELTRVNDNLNKCNQSLQESEEEVSILKNHNDELSIQVRNLMGILQEKDSRVTNLEGFKKENEPKLNEAISELNLIKESHGYKILLKYYRFRDNLLPMNSKRRQLSKLFFKMTKNPSLFAKYLTKSNIKKSIYYLRKGNVQSLLARIDNKVDDNDINMNQELLSDSKNYFLEVIKKEHKNNAKSTDYTSVVDIIVPIYNAVDFLKKCIDSVFKNTDMNYNLYLLNDRSPDPQVYEYLEELKQNEMPPNLRTMQVIHNEINLGFVSNVNKGLSLSDNHAVILNTDTEVPRNWLSRLMRPIFDENTVSSVTPFSNSATICSFPRFCEDNEIPKNLNVNSLDEIFAKYGSKELVTLPTGVGFCMALNRNVLNNIGFFDAEAFGKGYGEENDWCMRAYQEGYKNVLVQNLFVYHKHGVSFNTTSDKKRDKRIEENLRIVEERYPNYIPWVHKFIKEDPIRPVRDLLTSATIARSEADKKGYLFINHSLGGGTQLYQDNLIKKLKDGIRVYTLTLKNRNIVIEDKAGNTTKSYSLREDELTQAVFNNIVELLNIDLIYINQLITFSPFKMMELIRGTKLDYICFVHDYFWACPSYCLIDAKEKYCFANTDINKCQKCISERLITEPWINMKKSDINIKEWREKFCTFLQGAYKVISPSGATKEIINSYYPKVEIEVVEHELLTEVYNTFNENNLNNDELVIAFIGAIGEQKGSHIIYELKEQINNEKLPMKLKVIGVTNIHQSLYKSEDGVLEVLGKYDGNDISKLLGELNVSIVVIPALWPETYSYTTSEAIMSGYPVITFNVGAPAERVIRNDVGWVTDDMTSESILKLLKELNNNRDLILQKVKNIAEIK